MMYKLVNGELVAMTEDEIREMQEHMQAEERKTALMERSRPLTEQEIARMLLEQQINSLDVDDNTALRMREFYPAWESMIGKTAKEIGFKVSHGGKLWKTRQAEFTFTREWEPGSIGMESLFTEICETHSGTEDDPIPYSGNMELVEGLYYHEEYVLYRCTRSTGAPVYHHLSELVGIYVEEVAA